MWPLFLPAAALAEVGDIHTVKVNTAAVHAAADAQSPKLREVIKGAEVMEMNVRGEWYEIFVVSSDGAGGWMHASTLALAAAAPAAKPAAVIPPAKGGAKTAFIREFEEYLVAYNARNLTLRNYTPFSGAEELTDGHVLVTVTGRWLEESKAKQKSSILALYMYWERLTDNDAARLIAVDSDGNEVYRHPAE